jgi:hypothetical protein
MSIHQMSIPALMTCGVLSAAACGGITEEGPGAQRLVFDLSRLVGGSAAPPDFVSVLATAGLRYGAGGTETSQVVPLGQSDSTVSFDVTVPSGSVRFRLDVLSNNQTPLYQADTTVTVDADNFAVRISPRAVNGVMVVWPRNPLYFQFTTATGRLTVTRWLLRNAGNLPIQWRVDTVSSDGVFQCTAYPRQENCKIPLTLNPSTSTENPTTPTEPDTIEVVFTSPPAGPTRTITFTSNIGQASFATDIP